MKTSTHAEVTLYDRVSDEGYTVEGSVTRDEVIIEAIYREGDVEKLEIELDDLWATFEDEACEALYADASETAEANRDAKGDAQYEARKEREIEW